MVLLAMVCSGFCFRHASRERYNIARSKDRILLFGFVCGLSWRSWVAVWWGWLFVYVLSRMTSLGTALTNVSMQAFDFFC